MATKKAKKAKAANVPAREASAPMDLAKAFSETYRAAPPAPVSTTVTLDPDVAPHFQNARAVNEALRALLRIVKQVRG